MPQAYLLDTNTCIELIRGRSPRATTRLTARSVGEVAVSSLTVAELEYGVAKSAAPDANAERLALFLSPLDILAFDDAAAHEYGRVRADLERKGATIGPIDVLLAAHALSRNLTMVTNNRREFARVKGLNVEDWTAA